MELYEYFKSLLDQDTSAVVICDTAHKIIYMNPVACQRYSKNGGEALLGKNLLDCHHDRSRQMINRVLDWFREKSTNNCVHTYYNEKENKDVYMVALRDGQGSLIGYYEKHRFRSAETGTLYDMP